MARVLVTGYGGFLGSAIARKLLLAGFQVRGLARGSYPSLEQAGVEATRADITQAEVLTRAVEGCDAVVHTAAKAGVWGNRRDYYTINTQATERLLEASRVAGCRTFVYTSSPSVTFAGEHQSGVDESVPYPAKFLCSYPETKALAEASVLRAGKSGELRTCSLRPHLIWGVGDPHLFPRVVERAKAGRLRRVGSGQNMIDVVHVESAAEAHVSALRRLLDGDETIRGQAFFLSDGQPVACWEWISQILSAAGVAVPSATIGYAAAYRLGAMLELLYWLCRKRAEPPMTRFVAAQLALDHYFNIDKARRLLDYNPTVDRAAELSRCGEYLRGEGR